MLSTITVDETTLRSNTTPLWDTPLFSLEAPPPPEPPFEACLGADGVGVLRLRRLQPDVAAQVRAALATLAGAQGLLLDLCRCEGTSRVDGAALSDALLAAGLPLAVLLDAWTGVGPLVAAANLRAAERAVLVGAPGARSPEAAVERCEPQVLATPETARRLVLRMGRSRRSNAA